MWNSGHTKKISWLIFILLWECFPMQQPLEICQLHIQKFPFSKAANLAPKNIAWDSPPIK